MHNNPLQGILLALSSEARLIAYCESDRAGCSVSHKSTTGFAHYWVPYLKSQKSRLWWQEAQLRLSIVPWRSLHVKSLWLVQLLKDIGLSHHNPTILKCDYKAALSIVANPVHHERTKHNEVDCHFIREKNSIA